nr:integrase, catalytic region, zinc finger, CCHC-type, peptidase aspartic, catalytic [Tanacetum cinerariifolium]
MCVKSVMINKHDLRVPKSVAKPLRKTVASESIKKPRNNVRKLNERFGKISKWTYIKFTPSWYMWKPKSKEANVNPNLIEIVLFIVDSGCSKHMTGLNHNLFSVGQFCDADLEVAFRKSTCFIRDLKGHDLLT